MALPTVECRGPPSRRARRPGRGAMGFMAHNDELSKFLRSRRVALGPEAAGLEPPAGRRVPGLRRRGARVTGRDQRRLLHAARAGPADQPVGRGAGRDRVGAAARPGRTGIPLHRCPAGDTRPPSYGVEGPIRTPGLAHLDRAVGRGAGFRSGAAYGRACRQPHGPAVARRLQRDAGQGPQRRPLARPGRGRTVASCR
jgi:hypothetical protein